MVKDKDTKIESDAPVEVVGTPTLMLLPARNYKFKVHTEDYVVKLPRKGTYVELDNKIFSNEDGEFDFLQYSEEDDSYIVYLPTLSKVLFAVSKYPDLNELQAFTPIALKINKDEVEVVGNVIEMTKGK